MDTADRRLFKTSEMMEHTKLLKMYAWEDLFCERVIRLRSREISTMWRTSVARVFADVRLVQLPGACPSDIGQGVFVSRRFHNARPSAILGRSFHHVRHEDQDCNAKVEGLLHIATSKVKETTKNPNHFQNGHKVVTLNLEMSV